MSRILAILYGICGAASGNIPALASESIFPDIARIEQAGRLVVAVPATDRPPYVVYVEGGTPRGFDVWLAQEVAAALGVELEIDRSAETPADVVSKVSHGEADFGLGGIGVDIEAAKRVRFSQPYVREHPTLLLNRREALPFHSTCPSFDELGELMTKENKVGLAKGTHAATLATELFPGASPRLFDDELEQFEAVLTGQVVLSVHDEAEARYRLRKQPGARIDVRLCLGGGASGLIAIAVRPDAPDLLGWVNTFLEKRLLDLTTTELLDFGTRQKLWP